MTGKIEKEKMIWLTPKKIHKKNRLKQSFFNQY